jgi:thiol-disulfide isomerase/thioredoxin
MIQKALSLIIILLVLTHFVLNAMAWAETTNKVTPIDKNGLEAFMQAKGGLTVIIFMASWCTPCKKNVPILIELSRQHKPNGLDMIGVSIDLDQAAMEAFVKKYPLNFPVFWAGEAPIHRYNLAQIPVFFFVKNGQVVEKIVGKRPKDYLDQKIQALLPK